MPHMTAGSRAPTLPAMYSREVAEAVPFPQHFANARLDVFEGGGHLHNVEDPGEFSSVPLNIPGTHP